MLSKITASLICMDLSDIKTDIDTLLENGINNLHADFMDNTFVPRLGISPELIQWIRKRYGHNINIDSHLMVQNPYDCIDVIAPFSDWVFFHYEAVPDPMRILQKIDNVSHAKKGITYNLATIPKIFPMVDGIMLMGISPGVLGTKSWPSVVIEKILELRHHDVDANIPVFVDGGVNFKSIKNLTHLWPLREQDTEEVLYHGADYVVCGSSTLFKIDDETKGLTRPDMIKYNIKRIKECLNG